MDKLPPAPLDGEFDGAAEKEIRSLKEELGRAQTKTKTYTIITIIALVTINVLLIFFGGLWAKTAMDKALHKAAEELAQDIEAGIKEDVRNRITRDILKEYAGDHYIPDDYTAIGNYADRISRPATVEVLCGMTNITVRATGIILSSDGYVLTNTHVVTHKTEVPSGNDTVIRYDVYPIIKTIVYGSSSEHEMTLVAYDADKDLAILKFVNKPSGLTPAAFCDSDLVRRGEEVALIGNTVGYGLTVTVGVIAGNYSNSFVDIFFTDALALSGTSGAGLFNIYGEVVGIISVQLFSTQTGNMAGAITANSVIKYIEAVNQLMPDANITYIMSSRVPGEPEI